MNCFPLNCPICKRSYSDMLKPRNLHCGHCVCSECASEKLSGDKQCPECRCRSIVKDPKDLSFNYPLTALVRRHKKESINIESQQEVVRRLSKWAATNKSDGMCSSHGSPLCFLCITCSSWVCQVCLVIEHKDLPRGSCRIVSIPDAFEVIKLEFQKRKGRFLEEVKTLKRKREPESTVHELCRKYCHLGDNGHKNIVMRIEEDLKEIIQEDDKVVQDSVKQLDGILRVACRSSSPTEITSSCKDLVECQESFMKRVTEKERAHSLHQNILEHLRMDLTMTVMGMTKPLYAVQVDEGNTRWSLVAPEHRGLLLHSLRDGLPPSDGITLPYKYVRELVSSEDPRVFLTVEWGGEFRGIVYARIFTTKPLGMQTMTLFSGEQGDSFRGTRFYEYDDCGSLHGGDYLNNDGSGKVFRGIGNCATEEPVDRLIRTGALEVDSCFKNKLYFQLKPHRHHFYSPVGQVIRGGMALLRSASQRVSTEQAGIRDCGLFIHQSSRLMKNVCFKE